jgi:Mycothiol maleylpyruvate isomerase N-terminal domain
MPPRSTIEYPISQRHNLAAADQGGGMRLDEDAVRATLADAWERWAHRCAKLTPQQWSTATRCRPWDVRELVAHLCPDRSLLDMLNAATIDEPAAVTDAAAMLRRFNAPGGIAHSRPTGSPNAPPPPRGSSHPTTL